MTEPEAQAFAERLTRIWVGSEQKTTGKGVVARLQWLWDGMEDAHLTRVASYAQLCHWPRKTQWWCGHDCFHFHTYSAQGHYVCVSNHLALPGLFFCFKPRGRYSRGQHLSLVNDQTKPIRILAPDPQFVAAWLLFFRRGCWLFGCDVEATAQEKAEWI